MPLPSFRSTLPALLMLVACQSAPSSEQASTTVQEEVRDAVESLMGAMNAHDADAVLAHYERSADFTYLGVTDLRVGWDRFARTVRPWYDRHEDVTFDYEIVRIRALAPDVALAVLRGRSTEAPALAWTQVWSRDPEGAWRIVHEHESWPGAEPPASPHAM